jgi:hypothetical protein
MFSLDISVSTCPVIELPGFGLHMLLIHPHGGATPAAVMAFTLGIFYGQAA